VLLLNPKEKLPLARSGLLLAASRRADSEKIDTPSRRRGQGG
jgi:hypothetical protein